MNKKILLIEDDQIFANIYRNKLLLDGFQVEIAADGEAGLDMVRGYRPDAILLDLMLPKLPGVEIIKKLRMDQDFLNLPILVFTNTYLTSTVQDAWKAGATKCLAKADCTPKQVIHTLHRILSGNGSQSGATTNDTVFLNPQSKPAATLAPAPSMPWQSTDEMNEDEEFQSELRKTFVESLPALLGALRILLQGLIKAENQAARLQQIQILYTRVRSITSNAGMVELRQIAHMGDALEALLKELHEKPKNINASTLRTVASAIDVLGLLFDRTAGPPQEMIQANVLVVDDEAISRRALNYALEKAKFRTISTDDPLQAFQLVSQNEFDLILLDVHMPNMNGFELCSKLRTLPGYKKTPVVFVTSLNDFESRANSTMSGGTDFIAKPFLFIELAVKALVHVLRGQVESVKA